MANYHSYPRAAWTCSATTSPPTGRSVDVGEGQGVFAWVPPRPARTRGGLFAGVRGWPGHRLGEWARRSWRLVSGESSRRWPGRRGSLRTHSSSADWLGQASVTDSGQRRRAMATGGRVLVVESYPGGQRTGLRQGRSTSSDGHSPGREREEASVRNCSPAAGRAGRVSHRGDPIVMKP